VEGRDLFGAFVGQGVCRTSAKQVVVAVPVAGVVERDDEQVGPLQPLQHGPAVGPAGDGVAQLTSEPVRMEVPVRKLRIESGWRPRTSSTR
jgi:hypothetical protein